MERQLPALQWLRSFESAARTGSLTAAAKELSMTQAAMSQHIKLLEHWTREPLFYRLPRGLTMTDAGLALAPIVSAALDQLSEGLQSSNRLKSLSTITLKVPPALATFWLPSRIARLQNNSPLVELRVITEVWPQQMVSNADLEIRHGNGQWPNLHPMRLSRDELFAVASGGRALELGSDFIEMLKHIPLISTMGYQQSWLQWSKHHKISIAGARHIHTDSEPFGTMLCLEGQGIMLSRAPLHNYHLRTQLLTKLCHQTIGTLGLPSNEGYFLIANSGSGPLGAHKLQQLERVIDWIKEEFNKP
jgi:LysR family glycine cleavage system transcriptional activator